MTHENMDECPKCKNQTMKNWSAAPDSKENARMCQNPNCKFIEEVSSAKSATQVPNAQVRTSDSVITEWIKGSRGNDRTTENVNEIGKGST